MVQRNSGLSLAIPGIALILAGLSGLARPARRPLRAVPPGPCLLQGPGAPWPQKKTAGRN